MHTHRVTITKQRGDDYRVATMHICMWVAKRHRVKGMVGIALLGQQEIKSWLRRVTFTMHTLRVTITKQRGDDYRAVTEQ